MRCSRGAHGGVRSISRGRRRPASPARAVSGRLAHGRGWSAIRERHRTRSALSPPSAPGARAGAGGGSTRGTAPRRYARWPGWRWPTPSGGLRALPGRVHDRGGRGVGPGRRGRSSAGAPRRRAPPPADAYNHLGWLRAQAAVLAAGDDVGQATVAVTAVIAEAEHQCMRLDALWARPGPGHAADRSSAHRRGEGTARCRVRGGGHGGDHRTATGRAASALARRADVAALARRRAGAPGCQR